MPKSLKKSISPLTRERRNLYIGAMHNADDRTSIRLEHYLWESLEKIAAEEGVSVDEICTRIRDNYKGTGEKKLAPIIRYATHAWVVEKNPHLYRSKGAKDEAAEKTDDPEFSDSGFTPYGDDGGKSPFMRVLDALNTIP